MYTSMWQELAKISEEENKKSTRCTLSEDVTSWSKYINSHEERIPENDPSLEVTKDGYKKQLKGTNAKYKKEVKRYFDNHNKVDSVVISQRNDLKSKHLEEDFDEEEDLEEPIEGTDNDLDNFNSIKADTDSIDSLEDSSDIDIEDNDFNNIEENNFELPPMRTLEQVAKGIPYGALQGDN